LGLPQYGGELVIRGNRNITNFDPYFDESSLCSIQGAWMERLVCDDWTLDPAVWDYKLGWHPNRYKKGQLAESWEFTDQSTHVVHLRKGIHWQDKPPANGREFIADDVVFHFKRLYGPNGDFTKPGPFHVGINSFPDLASITATDKYTVVFKFKTPDPEAILWTLYNFSLALCLENPDAVKKWGDVSDWHHALGTGPFILNDFVSEGSATLAKNPNYWGYDERYPKNKLPYVDRVKYLIIPNMSEALAKMCGGEIDVIDGVSPIQAKIVQKTNPEISQIPSPVAPAPSVDLRFDMAPFNDIKVRKAMQMSIDLPTIAKTYYQGLVEPYPATITTRFLKGWGFPYEEWPQDLKNEYAYNPKAARELLADAGHPNGFKTNVVANSAGDIELLQIVKTYFSQVGIDMEIRMLSPNEWQSYIRANKHDQLTYQPYGPFGHTHEPERQIGRFRMDPFSAELANKALAASRIHDSTTIKKLLKDANERAARQHFSISLLEPMSYSLCQPWVKGFNAQIHSTWMGGGGPCMASFYLGRFWIDKKLKNLSLKPKIYNSAN
jgi:ABC-type transport system substrate-binding protein